MDIIIKFLEESLEMYIFDNGQGCEHIEESDGLLGIRKKIDNFGGITKFASTVGEGFQIVIKILL